MRIQNYDNRRFDLERLKAQGKSPWFIAGASAGAHGKEPSPPRPPQPPELQIRELTGKQIEVYGNSYPYREHLKRLGGRWHSDARTWSFPASAREVLKTDEGLNESCLLWEGTAGLEGEELTNARAQYSEGYGYGQQLAYRTPLGKVFEP